MYYVIYFFYYTILDNVAHTINELEWRVRSQYSCKSDTHYIYFTNKRYSSNKLHKYVRANMFIILSYKSELQYQSI